MELMSWFSITSSRFRIVGQATNNNKWVYGEIVNPIDPLMPIWGNPGHMTANVNSGFANPNATKPISIQLDSGSTVNVWIYFQFKH